MKPFRFPLARLARVRAVQEEIARAEWSAADAQARSAEELAQMLLGQARAADAELREQQTRGPLSPAEVVSILRSIELLNEGLRRTNERARALRARADELRRPWRALATKRDGLDRLAERARANHRREAERMETIDLDQIAGDRAARRSSTDTTPQ